MAIKWRLTVVALQLMVLLAATYLVTGHPAINETWFVAGLLAVVVNPSLLEPFYPRPADVIANAIAFVFLYVFTTKGIAATGWNAALVVFALAGLLATYGVAAGQRVRDKTRFDSPRLARSLA